MNAPFHRRAMAASGLPESALPIILVGLPGSGKTTVSRHLATLLGVQATDMDAEIRRRARLTIPEIFAAEGEDGFRDRETRTLRHVLTSPASAQGVVALGGGTVLREENRELLRGRTVIYLEASPATAAAHVGDGAGRPLMTQPGSSEPQNLDDPVLARMAELHHQRAHLYEEVASHTVATDGLDPLTIAQQIVELLAGAEASRPAAVLGAASQGEGPRRIAVNVQRPYEVIIGHGLGAEVVAAAQAAPAGGSGGIALVYAEAVEGLARGYEEALAAAGLRVQAIPVPGGEESKCTAVLAGLWDSFAAMGLGRDGLVIGVGGGATTDLAGFAAATWLRGVPVIQVPTTLLGMVDAAVGGKTGIDITAGKNLVGAFHSPSAVICDLESLASLPRAELTAGLGEVVKCGFIADPAILDLILADADAGPALTWDSPVLEELVARAVRVKAAVVGEDLTEAGLREILNYGHTYAHAIETLSHYQWRHGEAVAVGCIFAAEVAHRMGFLDAAALAFHREAFSAAGLPTRFPQGSGHGEEMLAIMGRDKKVRGGKIRMVLLDGVGSTQRGIVPGEEILLKAHAAVTGEAAGEQQA